MKRVTLYALAVLSIGFAIGLVMAGRLIPVTSTEAAQASAPAPLRASVSLPAAGTLPDLSAVAEAALKASANIYSNNVQLQRVPFPWSLYGDEVQRIEQPTAGSGVVVSTSGLILTNAHVIGNTSTNIRATLSDGKERPAKLVGIDELTDLAVIKVDPTGVALQTLPWGDSSKLKVAEWVLAIGNPFQLSGTVTLGIVSTVSRSQTGSFTDYVQTDAAVNPGNSGGALVNARGELVGINSAIFSRQDEDHAAYQGISFAIPSNTAKTIMDELVAHGSVPWGSIGTINWVDADTAAQMGWRGQGLLVTEIYPNGAAYRAGLRPGDWILSYNGQRLTDSSQLSQLIARSKIGERVPIEVVRVNQRGQAERGTITVTIESRAQQQAPSRRGR